MTIWNRIIALSLAISLAGCSTVPPGMSAPSFAAPESAPIEITGIAPSIDELPMPPPPVPTVPAPANPDPMPAKRAPLDNPIGVALVATGLVAFVIVMSPVAAVAYVGEKLFPGLKKNGGGCVFC